MENSGPEMLFHEILGFVNIDLREWQKKKGSFKALWGLSSAKYMSEYEELLGYLEWKLNVPGGFKTVHGAELRKQKPVEWFR